MAAYMGGGQIGLYGGSSLKSTPASSKVLDPRTYRAGRASTQQPREETPECLSIGAKAGDLKALRAKLNEPWHPRERVKAIDNRIKDYEYRHGDLARRLQGPANNGNAELAILNKAVQDGEQQLQIQNSEVPTVEVIKSGARDFIDYALTEVDRIVKVDKAGSVATFDWKSQGHPGDIPALRRSQAEHWVGRGGVTAGSPFIFSSSSFRVQETSHLNDVGEDETWTRFSLV